MGIAPPRTEHDDDILNHHAGERDRGVERRGDRRGRGGIAPVAYAAIVVGLHLVAVGMAVRDVKKKG
jgi:hypothetical protein